MDGILSSMGSLFDKKESSNPTPKTSIAQQPSSPEGGTVPIADPTTGTATLSDTAAPSAEATTPNAIDLSNIDLKSINFKNMGSKKADINNTAPKDTALANTSFTNTDSTAIDPNAIAPKIFERKPSESQTTADAPVTASAPTKQHSISAKNTPPPKIGIQDMKAQASNSFTPSTPISNNGPSGLAQDENRPSAVIGSKITFKGELSGDEDLLIQGIVEGTVSLKGNQLTVGKLGKVKANLSAKNIIVDGNVEGDLIAEDHIAINASSVVKGNIIAERVTLEDGAKFRGSIDMDTDTPLSSKPQGFNKGSSYTNN